VTSDPRFRIVNRAINPLLDDLPLWMRKYREDQAKAIWDVVAAFDRGERVVVVEAPTGSGKSLIGETVRRLVNPGKRTLYVCSGKGLQDQLARDFPYGKVLKGRSNYPTNNFADSYPEVSCADCTASGGDKPQCRWCGFKSACPYETAKKIALLGPLSVVNYSYLLTEANGPGRFSDNELVIADEADVIESELMNHVAVDISPRRAARYKWESPTKVTVAASWAEWFDRIIPDIEKRISRLPQYSDDVAAVKERSYLVGLLEKSSAIRKGLNEDGHPWVYTGRDERITFRPSRIDSLGQAAFWRHSEKWLLMSATVISADEMLTSLGWTGPYTVVRMGSSFPIENRRVIVRPVADMGRKGQDEGRPKVAAMCRDIAARHPTERMLLHTVSYDLTKYLADAMRGMGREVFSYGRSIDRDSALQQYLSTENSILVAPSMDRGVDLPGDACRVQIIVKAPFPYLGDRQVSARLHSPGGQAWFTVNTVRTIVQMTGRAVRSADDYAVTYILDSQFVSNVYNRGRQYLPSWWRDALTIERVGGR
jgi:ATP-dependent DNA helicase DinG